MQIMTATLKFLPRRDQALFIIGGEAISKGAILYRDFWDVKPPGIFGVYTLGGKLFGFTGAGIHIFDGVWMGARAIMLRVALGHYFTRSWIAMRSPHVDRAG
jgi:hypothetical protein